MGRFPVCPVRIGLVISHIGRRIAVHNGTVFCQTVRFSIVLEKPLARHNFRACHLSLPSKPAVRACRPICRPNALPSEPSVRASRLRFRPRQQTAAVSYVFLIVCFGKHFLIVCFRCGATRCGAVCRFLKSGSVQYFRNFRCVCGGIFKTY